MDHVENTYDIPIKITMMSESDHVHYQYWSDDCYASSQGVGEDFRGATHDDVISAMNIPYGNIYNSLL